LCAVWAKLSWERRVITSAAHARALIAGTCGPTSPVPTTGGQLERRGAPCQGSSAQDGCGLEDLLSLVSGSEKERLEALFRKPDRSCGAASQPVEPCHWQVACEDGGLNLVFHLDEVVYEAHHIGNKHLHTMVVAGITFVVIELVCIVSATKAFTEVSMAHGAACGRAQQLESRLEAVLRTAYDARLHVEAVRPFRVVSSDGRLGHLEAADMSGTSVLAFAAQSRGEEQRLSLCLEAMARGSDSTDLGASSPSLRLWWKDRAGPGLQKSIEVELTFVERVYTPRGDLLIRVAVRQICRSATSAVSRPPGMHCLPPSIAGTTLAAVTSMSADFDSRTLLFLNCSPTWVKVLRQHRWRQLAALLTEESSSMLQSKLQRLLRSRQAEASQTVLVKFARHRGVGMIVLRHRAADPAMVRFELELCPSAQGAPVGRAGLLPTGASRPRHASTSMAPTSPLQCEQMLCEVVRHCNFGVVEGSCCTFHAGLSFVKEAMQSMSSEDCAAFSRFHVADGWQCPVCSALNDDDPADDPCKPSCRQCFGCGEDTRAMASQS